MMGLALYAEQCKRELLLVVDDANRRYAERCKDERTIAELGPVRQARRNLFVYFGIEFKLRAKVGWVRLDELNRQAMEALGAFRSAARNAGFIP